MRVMIYINQKERRLTMKTIIKREWRNYMKNPVLWVGILFIIVELFQILNPYLNLHYFQTEEEVESVEPENRLDADITEGYVLSTEDERMELVYEQLRKDLVDIYEMTEVNAKKMISKMRQEEMSVNEMEIYLENYGCWVDLNYYYYLSEFHKGNMQEANEYIQNCLATHSFSFYFARKYADFCGLFMGFFATILLAFLFIRDTKRDTYELLHTKPICASSYVCGKIAGGFFVIVTVWGFFTLLFGLLCEFHGLQEGFPVNFFDFLIPSIIYILPNMLMITCVYTIIALVFRNPLPAVPCMLLYLIYSNIGSRGPDGTYGYYGRPLAIMVRFPGQFFETAPPPLASLNQTFLICTSAVLTILSVIVWKRRRMY